MILNTILKKIKSQMVVVTIFPMNQKITADFTEPILRLYKGGIVK